MLDVYVKKINHLSDIKDMLDEINFSEMFFKGEKILLKPNFVAPRENKTGATTNLELIKIIADNLHKIGAKPALIETPGMEYELKQVLDYLNISEFAQKNQIELIIPAKSDYVDVKVPNYEIIKYINVPKTVLENKIINIPVMKTHVITTVTLGMKNLMGLCSDKTKRNMHIRGIHKSIIDLNKVIKPTLTIIDAINCMEGDGAVYGNVRKANYLLAGKNITAVDKVACKFMCIDINKVKHISGFPLKDSIKVIGNFKSNKFQLPKPGKIYNFLYRGLYVIDVLFERIFSEHFNTFLYKTGHFGTRPVIQPGCTKCSICLEICPTNAIDIERKKINYKLCLRCLRCYEACPENAISVKGFSNPEHRRRKNVR
ncbi:MAG: hypothetical protein B1H05_02585 [Candidatus Cloacimonas sp. 4484_140]|nr:MAG: hypothetical protein B1H05_02585 [Candidatus Cloacimonas sp. 4484_140]